MGNGVGLPGKYVGDGVGGLVVGAGVGPGVGDPGRYVGLLVGERVGLFVGGV